jgi:hypothetical protein
MMASLHAAEVGGMDSAFELILFSNDPLSLLPLLEVELIERTNFVPTYSM